MFRNKDKLDFFRQETPDPENGASQTQQKEPETVVEQSESEQAIVKLLFLTNIPQISLLERYPVTIINGAP